MEGVACFQSLLLCISWALLRPSLKVPGKWALLQVPQQGPCGEKCPFPKPSFTYPSRSPVKESPCRYHRERCSISRALLNLSLEEPSVNEPPTLHVPHWGPYGERCSFSRASGLFIHSCHSESPFKELSHKLCVKYTWKLMRGCQAVTGSD